MRILSLFVMLLTLTSCGSSDSNNELEINAQVFKALQQDYLWYGDLPSSINAADYNSPQTMLAAVAAPQDRFSFIMTGQEYEDRFINATFFGYGFSAMRIDNDTALQVAYVYDAGSAAQNGLRRGDKIIEIEGVSVADWLKKLDTGLVTEDDIYGPNEAGVVRNFVWRKPNGEQLTSDFIKDQVSTNTVLHRSVVDDDSKRLGYLVFNAFIELSETELEAAFADFSAQGVNELILDLRYNGGGLIRVANQLSAQIAANKVTNKTFVKYQYNDKNWHKNTTTLFSLGAGQTTLNLDRVIILTTEASCSASELVINSLSPFIEVVQIGETTCGKPVGMMPDRIGNYVLMAINFQTVNALDQGDYFDGLNPNCYVSDSITGDWGATDDPLLAEAFYYVRHNQCSNVGQAFAEKMTSFSTDSMQRQPAKLGLAAQFANER
ncbi:S41 family peptidase [Rheinheimera sp. WS51]|uniref:S41 family peptidase n=1 Tax=Rheinheimera sp. WS51 TaxID=3425886 RepID=UPI003D8ADD62